MDGFLTGTGHRGQRHRHRPLWPAFTVTSPDSDGLARSAPLTTESRYPCPWLRLERLSTPLCRVPLIRHTPLALVAHAPTARRDARFHRSGRAHVPTPDSDILRPHQPSLGAAPMLANRARALGYLTGGAGVRVDHSTTPEPDKHLVAPSPGPEDLASSQRVRTYYGADVCTFHLNGTQRHP